MKLRKLLAVTAVAATMTAAFAVNAMAEETLKLYEGTDFTYDAEKGIITLTTNKQHTTADPYTMLVVVNDEKPLETTGEIPSDTSFDDTDIKQIDQADAKFEKITVGTLDPGTYEIRLGGDGNVRWGTLEVKAPTPDSPYDDPTRLLGDVSGDGEFLMNDVSLTIGEYVSAGSLTGDALQAADASDDGEILMNDVSLMISAYVNLETSELGTKTLADKVNLVPEKTTAE